MKPMTILFLLTLASPLWGASFPLACRGGEQTSVHWVRGHFPSPDYAYFTFRKTAQGHNTSPVGPWECAWLDRKVRHNEPSRVCLSGVSVNSFVFEVGGTHLATNWNAPRDKRIALGRLFGPDAFKILVENDGRGCLQFRGLL